MAEPIEMPFEGLTLVGPSNHVLDGGQHSPKAGQFWGLSGPLKSIVSDVYAAKSIIQSSTKALQCNCCRQL